MTPWEWIVRSPGGRGATITQNPSEATGERGPEGSRKRAPSRSVTVKGGATNRWSPRSSRATPSTSHSKTVARSMREAASATSSSKVAVGAQQTQNSEHQETALTIWEDRVGGRAHPRDGLAGADATRGGGTRNGLALLEGEHGRKEEDRLRHGSSPRPGGWHPGRRPRRRRRAASWVCDHEEGLRPLEDAAQAPPHGLRVEGREAFVENDHLAPLEERPRDEEPPLLSVGELPAALPDDLEEARGHPVEADPQAEVATEPLRLLEVLGTWRPPAAEEEVEEEGPGQDVVLVELRGGRHPPPPLLRSDGRAVEAVEEEEARVRGAQAREEGGEGGLAAARGALEEQPVPCADAQARAPEDRLPAARVAVGEVMSLEEGPRLGGGPEEDGGRGLLRPGSGMEERSDLLPGNRGAREVREPGGEFQESAEGEEDAAEADGQGSRVAPADEGGRDPD